MIQEFDIYFLAKELDTRKIDYFIRKTRDDAICLFVSVPGQRWEVEFLKDGSVEVEIFKSDGTIFDSSKIKELMDLYSY